MPEVHSLVGAKEARAIDHLAFALKDRLDQSGIIRGIILEIGVLDQHDIALDLLQASPASSALASISFMAEQADLAPVGQLGKLAPCAVRRAVVNDDKLFVIGHIAHPLDDLFYSSFFVVDGNNNRKLHAIPRTAHIG